MEDAENEQRSYGDRFWGYDNEIDNRNKERDSMDAEERRSRTHERHHTAITNHSKWEQEIKEEIYAESFVRALEQVQERRRYLKTVFSTETSQHVMDYKWSSRVKVRPVADAEVAVSSNNKRLNPISKLRSIRTISPALGMCSDDSSSRSRSPFRSQVQGAMTHKPKAPEQEGMSCASSLAPSLASTGSHDGTATLSTLIKPEPVVEEAVVRHVDLWDGHPDFKWDQEVMLKKSFQLLCTVSASDPESSSTVHILCLPDPNHLGVLISRIPDVQKMLRCTVFGSWVKRKLWQLFTVNSAQGSNYPSDSSLTLADWLQIAKDHASKECSVERRRIRTDEEHRTSLARSCNKWCERRERLSYLARTIVVGSMVWSLHGRGVTWLPAIVQAIHVSAPSSKVLGSGPSADSFTYDLSYITTQQAFGVASDLQNSAYQVTKLSAMALLADEQPHHNQGEEDDHHYQRVLNVTKSRCNNSATPERVLVGYVYDAYYAKNVHHSGEHDGDVDWVRAAAQVDALFHAIDDSQMTHSSEALFCVSGQHRGFSIPATQRIGRRKKSREQLKGGIWRGYLAAPLASRLPGVGPVTMSPHLGAMGKTGAAVILEREEWIETCFAAMDINSFNSY